MLATYRMRMLTQGRECCRPQADLPTPGSSLRLACLLIIFFSLSGPSLADSLAANNPHASAPAIQIWGPHVGRSFGCRDARGYDAMEATYDGLPLRA